MKDSSGTPRPDGRKPSEMRTIAIEIGAARWAEGSALVSLGHTRVLCAASVEDRVPPFLKGTGSGWVTAEYGMLPALDAHALGARGRVRQAGRAHARDPAADRPVAAQRHRAARDLGERTITLDCDVLQADGGTRCAAITGACVALSVALGEARARGNDPALAAARNRGRDLGRHLRGAGGARPRLRRGLRGRRGRNVVGTASGAFVEIQGTAERRPFSEEQLQELLALARKGLKRLAQAQEEALAPHLPGIDIGS